MDSFYICLDCIKDALLKDDAFELAKIENTGIDIKTNMEIELPRPECSFCNESKVPRLSIGLHQETHINNGLGTNHFINLLKVHTLRFFSSDDLSGDELDSPMSDKKMSNLKSKIIDSNLLLNNRSVKEQSKIDELLKIFVLSCGGGNINVLRINNNNNDKKLNEFKSPLLEQMKGYLKQKNFYQMPPYERSEIERYLKIFKVELKTDIELYRARINKIGDDKPYVGKDIGAGPIDYCNAGRLNRANESFLYLSNNVITSVSEIRPHIGHSVTVAKFQIESELKCIRISEISLLSGIRSDHSFDAYLFLSRISRQFSYPLTPDENNLYRITQYVAWVIRKAGYDGIEFDSSQSDGGINYVFFNPNSAKYVEGSSEIKNVDSINYEFKK